MAMGAENFERTGDRRRAEELQVELESRFFSLLSLPPLLAVGPRRHILAHIGTTTAFNSFVVSSSVFRCHHPVH